MICNPWCCAIYSPKERLLGIAAAFQSNGLLAALKGDMTLAELAQQFDVHPNQITDWKIQLAEGAAGVFGEDKIEEQAKVDVTRMQAKIGELGSGHRVVRRMQSSQASPAL